MLDSFLIFARGGIILFSWSAVALKGAPVQTLVQDVLLEERSGVQEWAYSAGATKYTLRFTFHNEAGLVFVAVYQSILKLLYVDDLLAKVREAFAERYKPGQLDFREFEDEFQRIRDLAEKKSIDSKRAQKTTPSSAGNPHKKRAETGKESTHGTPQAKLAGNGSTNSSTNSLSELNGKTPPPAGATEGADENGGSTAFDLSKLKNKTGGKKGSAKKDDKGGATKKDGKGVKSKGKVMRVWDGMKNEVSAEQLDFSVEDLDHGPDASNETDLGPLTGITGGVSGIDQEDIEEVDLDEDEEEVGAASGNGPVKRSWLGSMVRGVLGANALERGDVQPMLEALKTKLLSKNVASEIAEKLCESVANSLEGKKQAALTRVSVTVKEAMTEALTRILTPRRSTDVLREAQMAKEKGVPYSIVFVGVNGVGKSTNLAKVAYWLLQHDMTVMIAACDTFRAGAVEQLRTHCRRLEQSSGYKVPLFERGYEKDPASVASEALRQATRDKVDVLLVDTAGRMQDNKPLMEALAKLIDMNKPDLARFLSSRYPGRLRTQTPRSVASGVPSGL